MIHSSKINLSVALATFNEEANIADCLESIKPIAQEIIVVDGSSSDRTVEIARKFGAKVIITNNPPNFHFNKQKALEQCRGEWILQLDADERVSPKLRNEIVAVIKMNNNQIEAYQKTIPNLRLFLKHQSLLDKRDGMVGLRQGDFVAFFIPRLNYFLGRYLKYGGVYPDGVIRLIRNGKAKFPLKSVHEQIVIEGRVGWLQNDLLHLADPTFGRYWQRNSRYINLIKAELKQQKISPDIINFINYLIFKPIYWFLLTQIRHKGILDGYQGMIFSFFSALRFPRAYWRYLYDK